MIHPDLDPILYPSVPDKTINFGHDILRRIPATTVKTESSNVIAKFPERVEDVSVSEIWLAETASTLTRLFHQFHAYWTYVLPLGRYIGWQPRDLTPKNYFIEIIDVRLGSADEFNVEEIGEKRPGLMREQLTVTFRVAHEVQAPAGVIAAIGW